MSLNSKYSSGIDWEIYNLTESCFLVEAVLLPIHVHGYLLKNLAGRTKITLTNLHTLNLIAMGSLNMLLANKIAFYNSW